MRAASQTGTVKLLEMQGITKHFPGVLALENVSLSLEAGEVLALMGENGAGKSTLMKILGGAHLPDAGEIRIAGEPAVLRSVQHSKARGVALIHQELMLAPNLDITSNIFLGNERADSLWLRPLEQARMNLQASELLERVGLTLPVTTLVSKLTAGQMQMVEIAKALSRKARIIIMDEPTSSLASAEAQHLFEIIRRLKQEGMGIIYISHRMQEVMDLADRVSVLRDGRYIGDLLREQASHDKVVAMMVGRELSSRYFPEKRANASSEVMLEVRNLVVRGAPEGASFNARKG